MAVISDTDLFKKIKKNEYSNVYYFYGKDVLSIERAVKKVIRSVLKDNDETYSLHRFSGDNLNLSELADCVSMIPMFSEYICITVNDLNGENMSADEISTLIEIIEDVSESAILIFYITGFDVCSGKKFPTAKNKKIIDCASKKGAVCDFSFKKPADLVKGIIEKAEKSKCSISKENALYIAAKLLSDPMCIDNEMNKLVSYANGREITREDIDLLTASRLDSTAFDLAKSVVNFNSDKAYKLLDELFEQRGEAIPILAAVSMSFTDIYRAKAAILSNKKTSEVAEDFRYPKNRIFAVDNAFRDVRKTEIRHIRRCISVLANTDIKLKSTSNDGRLLIEEAIAEMLLTKYEA